MTLVGTGLATLLVTVGAGPATAYPPGPPTRTYSSQVSFSGTIIDSAGESVDLVGDLHVVTQLSESLDGWTLDWHANVGRATGTGQTSGYVLHGADGGIVGYPPGPPTHPATATFEPTFTLYPPGPPTHPPSPIRFLVTASFDASGHLTGVVAAPDVHGCVCF